jgi:signal transduction histidine kinase/HAMP domain-containing protein
VWEAIQLRHEGWIEETGINDTRHLYTFTPVRTTSDADMYVLIDIPAEIVYAESNQISWRNILALGLVGVLALAAGRIGGDLFILRRVHALLRATKRVATGDLTARTEVPYEGGELSELSLAFDHMAATLEQREIERQRMEDALRASTHRAEALAKAAEHLNARLELSDVLQSICEEAALVFNVSAASVCLYDQKNDWFDVAVSHGLPSQFRDELQRIPRQIYDKIALAIGSPIVVTDLNVDARLPYADLFRSLDIHSMACATLKHQEKLVGILSVFAFQTREFTTEELILLRGLADQAALAVANARLYDAVKQQEQMRASLLRKTITAQEDERMRIARELHDETSQNLTAMMVSLDTANLVANSNLEKARVQLESARAIAMAMLHGIHQLIADLRPSLLDHRGLVPAIVWYGDQRLKPLNIELRLEENLDGRRLPPDLETCFFRIVQEGMTNVIRHAQASQVTIRLIQEDGCLTLHFADNGQGFDPHTFATTDELGKGLGLEGMLERTSIMGGDFNLQTAPGEGTVITVRIALPRREDEHE